MEDDLVLREAVSRRDAALAEARKLDEFVRLYNELRGRAQGGPKSGEVVGIHAPLTVVSEDHSRNPPQDSIGNEFILNKSRPLSR